MRDLAGEGRRTMDRLSPLDAAFLEIESDVAPMHLGAGAVFEGPSPSLAEVRDAIAGKLPLARRYRQVVRRVPGDLGRPVWVDAATFTLDDHIRRAVLPPPGHREQFADAMAAAIAARLDHRRPLWDVTFVQGLAGDRWALVSKVHHAVADGIAGTRLLRLLLDEDERPSPGVSDATQTPPGGGWDPAPPPADSRLLADALTDAVSGYRRILAQQPCSARTGNEPLNLLCRQGLAGAAALVDAVRPAPPSPVAGRVGRHRRYDWARADLSDIGVVRRRHGATLNDVVLAAVGAGFCAYLLARGEEIPGRLRTLVPVSVREQGERRGFDNQVTGMVVDLPVSPRDAGSRLELVMRELADRKASPQAAAVDALIGLSALAPHPLVSLAARTAVATAHAIGMANVDTVVTNVPGPRRPLYALGRRLVEVLPYVPILSPVRIGISVFSYAGALRVGLTADGGVDDLPVLARGIERGFADLVATAG